MAEISGFFDSNNNDRVYQAADFARYFGLLASNGIFYVNTTNLQVSVATGMDISVAPGSAFINGYNYSNTDTFTLTLATADGAKPRIDRVVVRWDLAARAINLATLTGTAANTPTPPALTRTTDTFELAFELALADVLIPAGAVAIPTGNVTDDRLNANLCGLVNSLVAAVYQ
jgi:hypothetical protein